LKMLAPFPFLQFAVGISASKLVSKYDNASATILSVPSTCTYVGPYSLSNNRLHYARRWSNVKLQIVWLNCASVLLLSRKSYLA
jgi:hypothetical protein